MAWLKKDLESWIYKPNPVLRLEIPKPGKGAEVRSRGVPCGGDRVIHAMPKKLVVAAVIVHGRDLQVLAIDLKKLIFSEIN